MLRSPSAFLRTAASRTSQFEWKKIGQFYKSIVVPYIIGYLAFFLTAKFLLVTEWLGQWADLAGQAVATLALLALVATVMASVGNAKKLGYRFVEGAELDESPTT